MRTSEQRYKKLRAWLALPVAGALVAPLLAGCMSSDSSAPSAQDEARRTAAERANYVPVNDVEGANYNGRQRLADDPSSIIWCTIYPSNPNVAPVTVPIVGKLTSGNKRPDPTSQGFAGGSDGTIRDDFYTTELPGTDGFYGTSGEYRYGFDPAGNYHDFYNLETYCTSTPTVWQKNSTEITITVQGDQIGAAEERAEEALAACRETDPDPSHPCREAADVLGVS